MATKPTIVFVPGLWEGPMVFETVASLLSTHGYPTTILSLQSTGKPSPGNPTLTDDVNGLRAGIKAIVDEGKEVILVLHSAGGFLGPMAIKGLATSEMERGGVKKLVFMAAGVLPEGHMHAPLPFFEYDGGKMFCKDVISALFNDMPLAEAEKWVSRFECQPASGWDAEITYAGWRVVPSVYLICEKDGVVPLQLQQSMAKMVGSEIETCDAGHMVMLSQPHRVVECVRRAAGESV